MYCASGPVLVVGVYIYLICDCDLLRSVICVCCHVLVVIAIAIVDVCLNRYKTLLDLMIKLASLQTAFLTIDQALKVGGWLVEKKRN